jgi:hypothetical protein
MEMKNGSSEAKKKGRRNIGQVQFKEISRRGTWASIHSVTGSVQFKDDE